MQRIEHFPKHLQNNNIRQTHTVHVVLITNVSVFFPQMYGLSFIVNPVGIHGTVCILYMNLVHVRIPNHDSLINNYDKLID